MTVISSVNFAISGYQSETQIPLWPCCAHFRCDGIMELLLVPIAVITRPNDAGMGFPASFSSSGLGSNRSTWLGPPSMNSQITDFAVGLKCGGFGFSGSTEAGPAADAPLSASRDPSASAPRPDPALARKSRRERGRRLCAISNPNCDTRTRLNSAACDRNLQVLPHVPDRCRP